MTDINEKDTMAYFLSGIRKAKSAAKELAGLNSTNAWLDVRRQLDILERSGQKLFTGKAQTRLQTLTLANKIAGETRH